MMEQKVILNITKDIGNYVQNNIEVIRSTYPEFRKIMRQISKEMTHNLKDPERVERGTKGNAVANTNGRKARRDVKELTENEVVRSARIANLENKCTYLSAKIVVLTEIIGLRDHKSLESSK